MFIPKFKHGRTESLILRDWGWESVQYGHLTPIQVDWTSVSAWLCQHPWITCQNICQAHPCIQETGWQSSTQLCIMPRLFTHLVQESKVCIVDVRIVPIQRKQEIALKEQFVRCHCKTRCVTEHSSCRKM